MAKIFAKSGLQGGQGGSEWDDEAYEGIKKVYIGQDSSRISYVKFEYVTKDGQVLTQEHGKIEQQPKEFVIEYPNEYIISVEGIYNIVFPSPTEVITSLVFKTSKGRSSILFDQSLLQTMIGTKFVLGDGRKKIVGFHGRSGNALDALGVYLEETESLNKNSSPLYKLEAQGGTNGRVWDDSTFDGIKKIRLSQDSGCITYLEFEYNNGGKSDIRRHGVNGDKLQEFVVNYPNEYIKSVEATYGRPSVFGNTVITSIIFQTSTGKTSFFGYKGLKNFKLEQKGHRIVGFHGRESIAIDALGAYFAPLLPPAKKLEAVGGNGGVSWDDGAYDNVKTIHVGQGNDGVSFVKFEYIKGAEIVYGNDHGKKTLLGAEKFELEEGEYLTGIEGFYDKVYGIEAPLIVCLKFKTNKRESTPYGMESGEKFFAGENGYKIVGFHGKAGDVVHRVGV